MEICGRFGLILVVCSVAATVTVAVVTVVVDGDHEYTGRANKKYSLRSLQIAHQRFRLIL